ncbi:MAG: HPr family phosphocarrier protein [Bacillota bacterium]
MKTAVIKYSHPIGLHARPAALVVKTANQFDAAVSFRNLSASGQWVNAKSMLSLITAGVKQNDDVEIKTEGKDERQALTAIQNLFQTELNKDAGE